MLDVVESHDFITVTVAVTAVRDTLYTFTVSTLFVVRAAFPTTSRHACIAHWFGHYQNPSAES
jgi:hypothetical protein